MTIVKHRRHKGIGGRHEAFLRTDVKAEFTLTLKSEDLEELVLRAMEEGIGDWALITEAKISTLTTRLIDIGTNKEHTVTKEQLLKAISDTIIDFPYALDTLAGYNLEVKRLTCEDIDEIFQVAVFNKMQYKFIG